MTFSRAKGGSDHQGHYGRICVVSLEPGVGRQLGMKLLEKSAGNY